MSVLEISIFLVVTALIGAVVGYIVGRRGADDGEMANELALQQSIAERVPGLESEVAEQKAKIEEQNAQIISSTEARARAEETAKNALEQQEKLNIRLTEEHGLTRDLRQRIEDLEKTNTKLDENLTATRKDAEEKLAMLREVRTEMSREFTELANEALAKQGESLKLQNRDQLSSLLDPLHVRLKEFREGLDRSHSEALQQRTELKVQIDNLSTLGQSMTQEALNLTRALKSDSQAQGAWGEMILETILERSGLAEGREFHTQASHTTAEGQRIRPDVVVDLPGGTDRIVIDSKVSLTAFEEYVNAESEAAREAALGRHITSMRTHIKTLAAKDYAREIGTRVDYVIMFVPIEGALAAAASAEGGLLADAAGSRVMIATPTTLMALLRTVASLWQTERQNENARQIADRAGRLYDKFVGFVDDLDKVGGALERAQREYDNAHKKLRTGPGNLVKQAEQLRELGASAKKSLDPALVDGADDEGPALEHVPEPYALEQSES